MFNKVILVGNMTKDIELRYLPSGQALGKCGLATNRKWKDQSGAAKEETMFIDFTLWGKAAEVANQYTKKGSRILIEGRLTLEQWTDQQGNKRSRHSITVENFKMLSGRSGGEERGVARQHGEYATQVPSTAPSPQTPAQPAPEQELPTIDIDDDEIPF